MIKKLSQTAAYMKRRQVNQSDWLQKFLILKKAIYSKELKITINQNFRDLGRALKTSGRRNRNLP